MMDLKYKSFEWIVSHIIDKWNLSIRYEMIKNLAIFKYEYLLRKIYLLKKKKKYLTLIILKYASLNIYLNMSLYNQS